MKPDKCQICGISKNKYVKVGIGSCYKGLNRHHLKPKHIGGKLKDGSIYLCEKCHRDQHTIEGKINYKSINGVIV